MRNKYSVSYSFWGIGTLLPALILLGIIIQFSVNVPWFDDFDPFPDFLNQWRKAENLTERIQLMLKPNNEHRMVFGKIATLLVYWATGTLNFTYLHLIGFLFTLGTFGIFFKVFKENNLSTKEFAPVAWFLFQWQYQMVFLWAICSLQHQPVVFFLCLSMYLLTTKQFSWAVLGAFCANFSMSNGIFVWIAGAAVLIYQRAFFKLLLWLLFGIMAITAYFYGLTSMGNEQSFLYLQEHPEETFFGFFAFLGGLFDFFPDRPIDFRTKLPIAGGMVLSLLVSTWLWQVGRNWLRQWYANKWKVQSRDNNNTLTPFLLGILFFLLSNAAVIALLRPRFGFFVMVVSNYKLYPALYLMVIYGAFLGGVSAQWRPTVQKIGLGTSVAIWLLSMVHYGPMMVERRKDFYVNAFNQQRNGFGLGHEPNSEAAKYVTNLMQELGTANIYIYPSAYQPYIDQIKSVDSTAKCPLEVTVQLQSSQNRMLVTAPHLPTRGLNDGVLLFLRSSQKLYVFRMQQKIYGGRNVLKRYENSVEVTLPLATFLPSVYQMGFMVIEGSQTKVGIYRSINIKPNS